MTRQWLRRGCGIQAPFLRKRRAAHSTVKNSILDNVDGAAARAPAKNERLAKTTSNDSSAQKGCLNDRPGMWLRTLACGLIDYRGVRVEPRVYALPNGLHPRFALFRPNDQAKLPGPPVSTLKLGEPAWRPR
jgi:hypothetical protein